MPEFLRVRDEQGNEFDLPSGHLLIRKKRVEVLEDYPANRGLTAQARAAKNRVNKAGKPAAKSAASKAGDTGRDVGQPEKE
jgi:hypothetical protein